MNKAKEYQNYQFFQFSILLTLTPMRKYKTSGLQHFQANLQMFELSNPEDDNKVVERSSQNSTNSITREIQNDTS